MSEDGVKQPNAKNKNFKVLLSDWNVETVEICVKENAAEARKVLLERYNLVPTQWAFMIKHGLISRLKLAYSNKPMRSDCADFGSPVMASLATSA